VGDVEDYLLLDKKKPYPSLKKLARKRDGWDKKRKRKKKG